MKYFLLISVVFFSFTLSGCVGDSDSQNNINEEAPKETLGLEQHEEPVAQELDDGSVALLGPGSELSDNWPTDIALPDDIIITSATYEASVSKHRVAIYSQQPADVVHEFFKGDLEQQGWSVEEERSIEEAYGIIAIKDTRKLYVTTIKDTTGIGSQAVLSLEG